MTEIGIEIDHRPKIFDDPEYCNTNSVIKCRFLDTEETECALFEYDDDVYGVMNESL